MISDIFLHLNKIKKTKKPKPNNLQSFPTYFSVCTKKFFFDPTLPAQDIYNIHSLLQRISRFITKSSLRESRQGVLHLLQLKNKLNTGRRKSNATFKHINESIKVIELQNVKQNFSKSKKINFLIETKPFDLESSNYVFLICPSSLCFKPGPSYLSQTRK